MMGVNTIQLTGENQNVCGGRLGGGFIKTPTGRVRFAVHMTDGVMGEVADEFVRQMSVADRTVK